MNKSYNKGVFFFQTENSSSSSASTSSKSSAIFFCAKTSNPRAPMPLLEGNRPLNSPPLQLRWAWAWAGLHNSRKPILKFEKLNIKV